MKTTTLAAAIAAALFSLAAHAQDPAKAPAKPGHALPQALQQPATGPLATVNGVAIPRSRAEMLVRERASQGQRDSAELRGAVREELINREIILQEANRSGLAKRADLQAELELVRQTVIVQAYLREWVRNNPVTDAEVAKEYERIKAEMGDKEYKARHILVGTEDEAKGLIAELKKGGKFEDLARRATKDEGTKERGGDLDWQTAGTFDKDFSNAMTRLAKGKYTETLVKTRFGFHIIQLDDSRNAQHPPLAEVKQNLQQRLQRTRVEKVIGDLRAKAKIE
ncbi:MAG: peptidylprolyl isomerase [Betaproteobacteria bacterium]|nr:peptidylprolyl isomerase [Betaproteobacteria bacterium]